MIRVAKPPEKPLLIFDGDCNFCRRWVTRWEQGAGDAAEFKPSQTPGLQEQYPEIEPAAYEGSVQLIETDGSVYTGAEAVFRILAKTPGRTGWLWLYNHLPGFKVVSETSYKFVAAHRMPFSRLTKLFLPETPPSYALLRNVFIRLMAFVYFCAFASLWFQIRGLIGENGILPVSQFLTDAGGYFQGMERWHQIPTFCWWNASDNSLLWQCGLGTGLSVLLMFGFLPSFCALLLWCLFLSLTTVGQDFLGFQWENLLLESGLLTILWAPLAWRLRSNLRPPLLPLFLLRLLLFRLTFHSGLVKIMSGDPAWRDFTALFYHYETQPLPTILGWHAYQLPTWWHVLSTGVMYLIELGVSLLIFAPRRARVWAFFPLAALQVAIALTGNYAYFNLLTIVLCLTVLDDSAIQRILFFKAPQSSTLGSEPLLIARARTLIASLVGIVVVIMALIHVAWTLKLKESWPKPISALYRWVAPFRSVNSYGLFAVMTKSRPEIIIEGSNDGQEWKSYEFKYKPGDLNRAPKWCAPHQPRLDWQMWFAALSDYNHNPWILNFCLRLLQGKPEVLALLEKNPFPDKPPKFIRALTYNYEFATKSMHQETGAWWKRTYKEEYLSPVSLNQR
jgi:predicted DCC family thiol-disulfide oxidoreductase YuxK